MLFYPGLNQDDGKDNLENCQINIFKIWNNTYNRTNFKSETTKYEMVWESFVFMNPVLYSI